MTDLTSISLDIAPATLAILTFFGIGLATFADKLIARDWNTVLKIAICVGGLALLALAVPGVSALQGAAIGLSASGLLTGVSFIGRKNPTPSDIAPVPTDTPKIQG